MNEKYFRKENEDNLDYAMRLIEIKKEERPLDLDWSDICEYLGLDLNKDSLRKSQDTQFGGLAVYNAMKSRVTDTDSDSKVKVQLEELKKERMKLCDERAALNRRLRQTSRQESLEELITDIAEKTIKEDFELKYDKESINKNKVGLLTLSDFHYGLEIDEFNNQYNKEIFRDRLEKLMNKTIEYLKLNEVNVLFVLGLGDYLSGIIHNSTRIENKETIVEQVMHISNYMIKFLNELSKYAKIYYYDVSDNHGRIFADKSDCRNTENFSMFIKWYLTAYFKDNDNIDIIYNEVNNEIGTLSIFDRNYAFVHGHRDKISDVVQNLSLMTKKFYDAVFIGHCHHFEANEVHGTYIYMNGTLSGTDSYANNLRKTSNPSQNLFIISENEGIECQYLIRL